MESPDFQEHLQGQEATLQYLTLSVIQAMSPKS